MYSAVTDGICVIVEPVYLAEQSSPGEDVYFWAYHVRIENQGSKTIQLRRRYWRITDSQGRVQEVSGEGVVGEQPVLKPGESFEYTSGTPLQTPSGIMCGTYFVDDLTTVSGPAVTAFEVKIPAFSLDSPHQQVRLN